MQPRYPSAFTPLLAATLALLHGGCTREAPPGPSARQEASAPAPATTASRQDELVPRCADYNDNKNVYWGDLHTHTAFSVDAYSFRTRNTPRDAYAFARGATKVIAEGDPDGSGPAVSLPSGRELDFDAVTDHSEWLPTAYGCGAATDGGAYDPDSPYYDSNACNYYRGPNLSFGTAFLTQVPLCGNTTSGTADCVQELRSGWQAIQQAANEAYVPCRFTTFNGYEWTLSQNGATLHRNVIFASDVVPEAPFTALDRPDPVQLWTELDTACKADAGCEAMTIPHNTNLSNGLAFDLPADAGPSALAQMVRYQRLAEIHQHKGNSECFYDPDAGYTDSRCQFEIGFDTAGGDQQYVPRSYLRFGLEKGLAMKKDAGINAYQFGFVGATDDHNGMPGMVQEGTWNGHVGATDDTALKRLLKESTNNPGGITGIWAEQNTRAALFAAMKRRETFATSGPRIKVRFYQTWSSTDFCAAAGGDGGTSSFPGNVISAGGVPMGGTMSANPGSDKPYFVVAAAKDLVDLAEIDIIKADVVGGQVREQVFPIALPGSQNLSTTAPCVTWRDDTYVPGAPAFYYARVLQASTPRWTSYDCDRLGALAPAGCDAGGKFREQIQERAWTSPIWSAQ